jgi:hypothetical protein
VSKFQEWLKENKNTTLENLLQVKESKSSTLGLSKLYPAGYRSAQHSPEYWASVAPSNIMANLAKDKMVDGGGGVKSQFSQNSTMKKKKKKKS